MKKFLTFAFASLVCIGLRAGSPENSYVETWLQYVPSAMHMGLGLVGVTPQNNFIGRAMELGFAAAAEIAIVDGAMKPLIHEERPDGSAFNSFPSGHTATAFAGAELVRLEYGWGWGAGAYALAAGVGAMRVVHKRHWWWDTMAGAGVGVLSANIGRWLMRPAADLLHMDTNVKITFAPVVDPTSGVYCASLALNF